MILRLLLLLTLPALAAAQRPVVVPRAGDTPPGLRDVVQPFGLPKLVATAKQPVTYALVLPPGRDGSLWTTRELVHDTDNKRVVARIRELRTRRFRLPLRLRLGQLDPGRSHLVELHAERRGLVGAYVLVPHKGSLALTRAPYKVARMLLAEDLETWILRLEGLRTPSASYTVTAKTATREHGRYLVKVTAKKTADPPGAGPKDHAVHSAIGKPETGIHLVDVHFTLDGVTYRGAIVFGAQPDRPR